MRKRGWLVMLFLMAAISLRAEALEPDRSRVIVLTDISSLTASVREPDDGQSLIRFLVHSNEFDVEGLVASSNLGHGQVTRPELILQAIDAYEQVWENLRIHDSRYPAPASLRAVVRAGQPVAGPKVKVEESVGPEKDTDASRLIIEVVDRTEDRPVWVLVWGGSADLAQALWRVRENREKEAFERFLTKVRVHFISEQDSTCAWIKESFPGLFTITQIRAYRGMYRGGNERLSSSRWVKENARGHGAPGELYPDYQGGDIWSSQLGAVRGIKEGDTPSFLAILPNGLTDLDHRELSSWGGRFEGADGRLVDVADTSLVVAADPDPRMSSVYRWRPAFQAEFEARLDWCVKWYGEANHPPLVKVAGMRTRSVKTGDSLMLDARSSIDPDGNGLLYRWGVDPAAELLVKGVGFSDPREPVTRCLVKEGVEGQTVPILLSVQDQGEPPLTRYGRVFLKVDPVAGNTEKP